MAVGPALRGRRRAAERPALKGPGSGLEGPGNGWGRTVLKGRLWRAGERQWGTGPEEPRNGCGGPGTQLPGGRF